MPWIPVHKILNYDEMTTAETRVNSDNACYAQVNNGFQIGNDFLTRIYFTGGSYIDVSEPLAQVEALITPPNP